MFNDVRMASYLLLIVVISVVLWGKANGEIGVTACTDATDCAALTSSVCDTIVTQTCVCVTSQGFTANANNDGCDYDCGALASPQNGAVTYTSTIQDSVATYSCNAGYQIDGSTTRTCSAVTPRGWSGAAPTCIEGQLGDLCNTITDLCDNIINGECSGLGICSCFAGYTAVSFYACQETNECESTPCINGGTCNDLINEFTCTCATGFQGTTCQTNPDDCNPQPCENGGICTDGLATFTCACADGYAGTTCATNIDECASAPCVNGGTCNDGVNMYTCSCVAGYDGLTCANDINECASDPCKNGATCNDLVNMYTCSCAAGYDGTHCQSNINECASNPCSNGGSCTDLVNSFTCTCASGYTGTMCDTNINECTSLPCKNGATCTDLVAAYTCGCVDGYSGTNCEINIDECASNPCDNAGTCTDLVNSFTCACVAGYTGVTCSSNINECASTPCQNFGTCTDGINEYTCSCVAGYNGPQCQNNIDECATVTCQNGGSCVDGVNFYTCNCVAGYTGSTCQTNINECSGVICQNGGTCVDQINAYSCSCLTGYTGLHCETNINECATNLCENGATCIDGVAKYTCECVDGYEGTLCQTNIDECAFHACKNGATCVDVVAAYTCQCVDGFTGQFCSSNINECSPNPCQNGGACTDGVNTFTCTCIAGYTGNTCGTDINDCSPNPCENGACTDLVNDFSCTCTAGYTGKTCNTDINNCLPPPCKNGGTCTDLVDSYYCTCANGYEGTTCTENIDDCVSHLCQNGATCVDQVAAYVCQCDAGYTGTYCETNINECVSHNCLNGGTCVDAINGYTCTCADGYTSSFCQTNINDCSTNPCDNGGTCTDLVNGYSCACADGFTGTTCRAGILNDDCSVRPGVCSNLQNAECDGSKCVCSTGYHKTGSSTCSKIDCGTIEPPENGLVNHDEGILYLDRAYFTCDTGYTRSGVSSVRCNSDQLWSGDTPTCVIKDCSTLSSPTHGAVAYVPNTQYQGNAEFSCDIGYTLSGTSTRTCLSTGIWSDASPVCVVNDCGTLTPPSNGAVDLTEGTKYTSNAVFTCNPGYTLVGDSTTMCAADSTWDSPKPTCIIKNCGVLIAPTNGDLNDDQGTNYGAIITFSCNTGYTLTGDVTRTCIETGQWSNTNPTCVINECSVLSNPTNGKVDLSGGTTYQSVAVYSCNAGFVLSGTSSRTCQADTTWSGAMPSCARKSCGSLSAPTNGAVDLTDGVLYEDVATFSCNSGFSLTGDVTRICQADTTWSGASPTCSIDDCGPLTNPLNGQVLTVDGTEYQDTAVYSCNQGYKINGVDTRTCMDGGQWSASPPTCVIKDCGPVANITNGLALYSPGTLYGATVIYTCNDGYEVTGDTSRACLADGTWGGSQPSCTILDCDEAPTIPNGFSWLPSGSQVGDYAVYSCNGGYGLVGDPNVLCEPSGFWGVVPECKLDCGIPPDVSNGVVSYPDGSLVGTRATYTCNSGYSVTGHAAIDCLTSGTWSDPPVCELIGLQYNELCSVSAQCQTVGATCRDDLSGVDRCLCAIEGEHYDIADDECLKLCSSLGNPTNGQVTNPAILAAGESAVYTCDTGYALSGPGTRTCLSTGVWSGVAPMCVGGCPDPENPSNGAVNTTQGLAAGNIIRYSCDPGYAIQGEEERICEVDSQWSGNTPSCVIECSVLPNVENGYVDLSFGNWEGSRATYICDDNHALIGVSTRTCESTGRWTGIVPECVFAIFPDVILIFGTLFIILMLVDIAVIGVCIYFRYCKKKPPKPEPAPEKPREFPEVFDEDKDTGVPPEGFLMAGSIPKIKNSGLSTVKKIYQHEAPRVVPGTKKSILREPPAPSMPKDTLTAGSGKATLGAIRGFLGRGQKKGLPESGEMGATTEMPSNVRLPKIGGGPLPWQSKETVVETPTFKLNGLGGGGDEGFRDGGYNTGNSDDNPNASMNSSIEDVQTIEGPQTTWRANASSSPVQTRRNLMDAAADTFRGRAPIPPVAGSPPTDRNGQAFTDETRRQLRGTVNAYISPTQHKGWN
ncbi:neurogenic locus notch homolog protein 1-like [Mya arenaria]|uniref:neurogenic locus notch homolog protein 1-like n=1 Tax=Mya arenaria TaxID=6604 RepID=UPI0022E6B9C5|nr:neurogenic locus notch homolog protein 1-like [Mya arenaria]